MKQQSSAAEFTLASAKLLPRGFYERDPIVVARELLGKTLVRRAGAATLAGRIVETEAYLGLEDAAAHSYRGETARNRVLFGPAGHAYVYFIYGVHYCLNVSCLKPGDAGCVLIRALEPLAGIARMAQNRGCGSAELTPAQLRSLTSGPGKLCQAFAVTRARDNGKDVTARGNDLQICTGGQLAGEDVIACARVGITKAAELPLRFMVRENRFVSRAARE